MSLLEWLGFEAPVVLPPSPLRPPSANVRVISKSGIARPAPADDAVADFLEWLGEQGVSGEHEWRNLWPLYRNNFCVEVGAEPVSERKRAYFAEALSKRARRGQIRIFENGRMRRITTYLIADQIR
jgi:hypothetical protein